MRGKGKSELNIHQRRRITPAYAGKSLSMNARSISSRDHPRVCGEKTKKIAL